MMNVDKGYMVVVSWPPGYAGQIVYPRDPDGKERARAQIQGLIKVGIHPGNICVYKIRQVTLREKVCTCKKSV